MNRFLTVSLALLLGLINAEQILVEQNEAQFLQDISTLDKVGKAQDYVTDSYENLSRLNCLLYDDLTFFDLRALEAGNTYNVGKHYFNFCKRLKDTEGELTFAYTTLANGYFDSNTRLTGGEKPSNVKSLVNETDADAPRHIAFEITGGEECLTDKEKNFKVRYEVFCDENAKDLPVFTASNLDLLSDPCAPKLTFTHATGCPVFQATSIVRFLSDNPWALGFLLIIFGTIVTFYGGKFFPLVLATIAGGVVFLVILLLASVLGALKALDKGKESTPGEITLAVMSFLFALGLGIFVGFLIKKVWRTGITILGTAAGFFIGFVLYTFVLITWIQHVGVLIASCGLSALLFGYLAYKYDKHIIIYLTSFIGAYAFIRGISMFAGNFPNEIFLIQQLQNEAFDGLGWQFYVYMVAVVVLGVLGCMHQFRKGYHKHEDEYDGYYKTE